MLMTKPTVCQNSLTDPHSLSGGVGTTSQRWVPERSMRSLPASGRISWAVEVRAAPARSAAYWE